VALVEGSGEQQFRVRSALALRVVEGGRVGGRTGPFTFVAVSLAAAGERRRVVLTP
jgi:hypothetical protein